MTSTEITYANIPSRIKAAFIDVGIVMVMIYLVATILSSFNDVPTIVRIVLFILVFGCYEPIFVGVYGATIGHSFLKLEVRKEKDITKTIGFFPALLRYIMKIALGWLSLLSMSAANKNMAMHDHAAHSVVIETK